jgi:hypothetical protein
MKKVFFVLAALLFVGAGCAALDASPQTYESEFGDFSYTLTWAEGQLAVSEVASEWTSENAPSFNIVGGGMVTVRTGQIDSPGYTMTNFVADQYYDGDRSLLPEPIVSDSGLNYETTFFNLGMNEDGCHVQYAVIPVLDEALAFRLEDCDGNDMKAGEAFGGLYSGVVIEEMGRGASDE